jgi:hypothetical protein
MEDAAMPTDFRRNALLAGVLADAPEASERISTVKLETGQSLFRSRAELDKVYFPLDCVLAHLVVLRDGNFVATLSVGREGAVARNDLGFPGQEVTVELGGAAAVMPLPELMAEAGRHRDIEELFGRYQALCFSALSQRSACHATHPAEARLATWLLLSEARVGPELLVTHEWLSQLLGMRRATASISLELLQTKQAVRLTRGRVTATDLDRLREHACECYELLSNGLLRPDLIVASA